MTSDWTLVAIGMGVDDGRAWIVATGTREDLVYRGELAMKRFLDIGVWARLPWAIRHLMLVASDDPDLAYAEHDFAITALGIVRGDRLWFVPAGTSSPQLGRSVGGTCNCRNREHSADEGVTMIRVERDIDGRELTCSVAWDAARLGGGLGRITARAA